MEDLLGELIDGKILKVLGLFYSGKSEQYYLQEIAKETKVPIATVFRIVRKLVAIKLLRETKIKKFKIYSLEKNEKSAFLESILKQGKRKVQNFANEIANIPGVEEVLLYGKEEENKANIIIIGVGIDSNAVKNICSEYFEREKYNVNPLILGRDQYEQFSSMGLYSGERQSLARNQ